VSLSGANGEVRSDPEMQWIAKEKEKENGRVIAVGGNA
jgi:hypothetical protein